MNLLSYQFTVFANTDIDKNIANIAKLYPSDYLRSRSINPLTGLPCYEFSKNDMSVKIDFSDSRIDCFYSNEEKSNLKDFLDKIVQINSLKELQISRIAINYMGWAFDENNKLLNNLGKALNLNKIWGDATELSIRSNNRQSINDNVFNVITIMQNGDVLNNETFVNQKSLLLHIDINNVPVDKLALEALENYFEQMVIILNERVKYCEQIINGKNC